MEIDWNKMVQVIFIDTPAEMRIREQVKTCEWCGEAEGTEQLDILVCEKCDEELDAE